MSQLTRLIKGPSLNTTPVFSPYPNPQGDVPHTASSSSLSFNQSSPVSSSPHPAGSSFLSQHQKLNQTSGSALVDDLQQTAVSSASAGVIVPLKTHPHSSNNSDLSNANEKLSALGFTNREFNPNANNNYNNNSALNNLSVRDRSVTPPTSAHHASSMYIPHNSSSLIVGRISIGQSPHFVSSPAPQPLPPQINPFNSSSTPVHAGASSSMSLSMTSAANTPANGASSGLLPSLATQSIGSALASMSKLVEALNVSSAPLHSARGQALLKDVIGAEGDEEGSSSSSCSSVSGLMSGRWMEGRLKRAVVDKRKQKKKEERKMREKEKLNEKKGRSEVKAMDVRQGLSSKNQVEQSSHLAEKQVDSAVSSTSSSGSSLGDYYWSDADDEDFRKLHAHDHQHDAFDLKNQGNKKAHGKQPRSPPLRASVLNRLSSSTAAVSFAKQSKTSSTLEKRREDKRSRMESIDVSTPEDFNNEFENANVSPSNMNTALLPNEDVKTSKKNFVKSIRAFFSTEHSNPSSTAHHLGNLNQPHPHHVASKPLFVTHTTKHHVPIHTSHMHSNLSHHNSKHQTPLKTTFKGHLRSHSGNSSGKQMEQSGLVSGCVSHHDGDVIVTILASNTPANQKKRISNPIIISNQNQNLSGSQNQQIQKDCEENSLETGGAT
eukprot:GDKK01051929.1.p1 GENE.GDKK01051929.1~~GDKK01051929.1.p1  ORF type:complete len:719 (+),score=195.14 GDKK01051929.1:172-2157(+)